MKLAHNFLALAIMLLLIGLAADRGRHVEPQMARDGLVLATGSAHASAEATIVHEIDHGKR